MSYALRSAIPVAVPLAPPRALAPGRGRQQHIDQYFIPVSMPPGQTGLLWTHKTDSTNFFSLPTPVLEWLDHKGFVTRAGILHIRRVRDFIKKHGNEPYEENHHHFKRDTEPDQYTENELRRLIQIDARDEFLPYLEVTGERQHIQRTLVIPTQDVYELPVYMLLYILIQLGVVADRKGGWDVLYTINGGPAQHFLTDEHNQPLRIYGGTIHFDYVRKIYMALMRELIPLYENFIQDPASATGFRGQIHWKGTEESGTRIILCDAQWKGLVRLHLQFRGVKHQNIAGCWTPEMERLLATEVKDCVISVHNESDNKCLVYCLIIGLMMKYVPGCKKAFTDLMVPFTEVYAKAMYLCPPTSPVYALLHRLAQASLPVAYSTGGPDELTLYVNGIASRAGEMVSVEGFRREFEDIEAHLIPDHSIGIDVYGIDYNINVHVYPLYMSKNRANTVPLLIVTGKDSEVSHYCFISNMRLLLQKSGGKRFMTCARCGACFYHGRLLMEHQKQGCKPLDRTDGGYHFSTKYAMEGDQVVGRCEKCRLEFITEFEYQYHKQHCLMDGKTGYRHVQLLTYGDKPSPTLDGVEIDEAAEAKHVKDRRVLYCDFESSIDSETGEHSFMSYGLFDTKTNTYSQGCALKDLFNYLVNTCCRGSEKHIYLFFHNAMNYDANFILRYVLSNPDYTNWGIKVIMKSSNRLQKLVFYPNDDDWKGKRIHIGDTFLFLTMSLEKIVECKRSSDLKTNIERFPRFFQSFRRKYGWTTNEDVEQILRKNIFPYKFFTSSSKLDTPIEEFLKIFEPSPENLPYFSERVTVDILAETRELTHSIVRTYKCTTAKDYHDVYLMCDVCQLADIFEHSMELLWHTHKIHLTKYLGMPSASWAAFLRFDPSMRIPLYDNTIYAEFFKHMTRGGVTSASLRYANADEKHSIIYLDVNGLYPYVMQQYKYPYGEFRWKHCNWDGVETCHRQLYEFFDMLEVSNKGACFCVDMHIPDDVKRVTDMYPFAPEHRKISEEFYRDSEKTELTPFLQRWTEANPGDRVQVFEGLVCTLYDKTEYNVHWRLLKFYMDHGVHITHVHFGVVFDESDYMAGYVRKNIEMRNKAETPFEKLVLKLMSNSVYGKTFESPFKRRKFLILNDETKLQGLIDEGCIASMTPIDDFAWVVQIEGEDIVLDKPTYIGACVCEYAKLHMYQLLYDKLMPMFPSTADERGCELVYTDTDSFIVRVRHPDGVDCSTPEKLFAYMRSVDPTLLGGIGGQVKSETGEDDTIAECIALRSKVYAYQTVHGHTGKRAKGTTYDAQEMQLNWELYKKTLDSLVSLNTHNVTFVREFFKVKTIDAFRRSLSVNDAKRYICEDGIHTHAYGYPMTPEEVAVENLNFCARDTELFRAETTVQAARAAAREMCYDPDDMMEMACDMICAEIDNDYACMDDDPPFL